MSSRSLVPNDRRSPAQQWWEYLDDSFLAEIAPDLGITEFSVSQKHWLAERVRHVACDRPRIGRVPLLAELKARRDTLLRLEGKPRRGRPTKEVGPDALSGVAKVALSAARFQRRSGTELEVVALAIEHVSVEPSPRASGTEWARYALIHVLAAAWGRRFPNARGRPMAATIDPVTGNGVGAFFRVTRAILRKAGHDDSDVKIVRAIERARRTNYRV
jgi:hypothetical protein